MLSHGDAEPQRFSIWGAAPDTKQTPRLCASAGAFPRTTAAITAHFYSIPRRTSRHRRLAPHKFSCVVSRPHIQLPQLYHFTLSRVHSNFWEFSRFRQDTGRRTADKERETVDHLPVENKHHISRTIERFISREGRVPLRGERTAVRSETADGRALTGTNFPPVQVLILGMSAEAVDWTPGQCHVCFSNHALGSTNYHMQLCQVAYPTSQSRICNFDRPNAPFDST